MTKTFRVQYDPAKNVANKRKHKVSLADAEAVFYDDMALEREDSDHDEKRWIIMGQDATGRVLVIAYTYREPDFVRVISARIASKNELHQYLEGDL
ncbi:BrnT family toxin [Pseudomonas sp. R1-15]|uniref:BrnT family toxin n=1 Tax=Pseudomonas sp. R1-15 TaxID=2817399 RepID=UPI003DA8C61D